MDWLRRNWPDLLIGVALIAVIAGIIATLISGGSFFPSGNRSVESPNQGSTPLSSASTAGPQESQAGAANDSDAAASVDVGQPGQASSLTTTAAAVDGASDVAGADDAASNAGAAGAETSAAATAEVATSEVETIDAATTDQVADPAGAQANAGNGLPVAVLPPSGQPEPSPQTAGAPSSAVSTAASTADPASTPGQTTTVPDASAMPDAPYRVSVGAYANRENAERQAETFASAGYPVFIGTQGELNIVLVGPYDSESEARSIAARISDADMGVSDPTVYEFTADEDQVTGGGGASTTTASAAASSSTLTTSAEPAAGSTAAQASTVAIEATDDDDVITTSPAAASGVRYLQAGAYGNRDSSLPQRTRLEGLGFVVTERVEDGLVKLLIGPFDANNLGNAQGRLEAAGIASFPR